MELLIWVLIIQFYYLIFHLALWLKFEVSFLTVFGWDIDFGTYYVNLGKSLDDFKYIFF